MLSGIKENYIKKHTFHGHLFIEDAFTKTLNLCGKFTLASDMSAIRDITSIDLSSMSTLEGKKC